VVDGLIPDTLTKPNLDRKGSEPVASIPRASASTSSLARAEEVLPKDHHWRGEENGAM
jgi:hypothetical protein